MRITIITPVFYPELNGLSVAIYYRCLSLAHKGHTVQLIIPDYKENQNHYVIEQLREAGVRINQFSTTKYLPAQQKMRTGLLPSLVKSRSEINQDVLQFRPHVVLMDNPHYFVIFSAFFPNLRKWKSYNITTYGILHSHFPLVLKKLKKHALASLIKNILPLVYNRFEKTFFPSSFLHSGFPNITNGKVVQFLGVNKHLFNPFSEIPVNGTKEQIILTVSRLAKEKGIDFLYNTALRLTARNPHVKWYFIGNGPNYTYWKHQETSQIAFLGPTSQEQLKQWYKHALIYVSGCDIEAFGLTISEAMAMQLPVLVSDKGATLTRIPEHSYKLTYQPEDATDILNKLEYLLFNKAYRKKIGINGRRHVLNWDEATENLIQAINGYSSTYQIASSSEQYSFYTSQQS